jgi:F-type H+-transporting ATPase subunit b
MVRFVHPDSEVRAAAVDAAVKASEIVLRAQTSGVGGNDLIAKGIDDVKRLMN